MKKIYPFLLLFTLSLTVKMYGQELKDDLVLAGRGFTWGLNMGSYDLAILLRKNGTFCESLDASDWQTKVEGRHKTIKGGILLEYADSTVENDTIFIEKDSSDGYEYINYSGAQMMKMNIPNTIPEGYYKYKSATSAGGMGTGMVYVGTQRYDGIHFYANGTFQRTTSSGVFISGDNVGGGGGSDDAARGTYTIEKGLLTLVNANGDEERNSFFYSAPDDDEKGTFTVAMNGNIFFSSSSDAEEPQHPDLGNETNPSGTAVPPTRETPDADILSQIKKAHGGGAIDSITAIEATIETSRIEFKVLIDLPRKFMRLESITPSFRYTEQLEADSGWIYSNGTVQEMPANRIAEMENTLTSGLFLLRSPLLGRLKILDIRNNGKGFKVLKLDLDGNISGMVVDAENHRMLGTAKFNDLGNEITYLTDFRLVDGILVAFREEVETDGQNVLVEYTSYTINPVWDPSVWHRPQ